MGRDGDKDAGRDVGSSPKNAALLGTDGLLSFQFFINLLEEIVTARI